MKNKSILKKITIALGIILILVIALFIIFIIRFPGDKTEFNTVDEFIAEGGCFFGDVPEGAEDFRYFYSRVPFCLKSIVSFSVNDTEDYDAVMEYYKDAVVGSPTANYTDDGWVGHHPYWNTFIENPSYKVTYTEEELEEMAYLEENYTTMDYKEILSLSRHKYGFLFGYGAKVSDFSETKYYHEFPLYDWYNNVIDESLDDYTVISYDYFDGTYHAVLVNEESRRFVMIRFITI